MTDKAATLATIAQHIGSIPDGWDDMTDGTELAYTAIWDAVLAFFNVDDWEDIDGCSVMTIEKGSPSDIAHHIDYLVAEA